MRFLDFVNSIDNDKVHIYEIGTFYIVLDIDVELFEKEFRLKKMCFKIKNKVTYLVVNYLEII